MTRIKAIALVSAEPSLDEARSLKTLACGFGLLGGLALLVTLVRA